MAFHKITYHEQYKFATLHNYGCTFRCSFCSYKLRSGADFLNLGALDDDTAVGQIGKGLASGDQFAVGKNVHNNYLLFWFG